MPLMKQVVNINFSDGINTKVDPFQRSVNQFELLQNIIFSKDGMLTKRNGFAPLAALDTSYTYLTTFNGGLVGIGANLSSYSKGSNTWIEKGSFPSVELDIATVIRNNYQQSNPDCVVSSNGLACVTFIEDSLTKYSIFDSTTGDVLVSATTISAASGNTAKVFLLGTYFIVLFAGSTLHHLQYIAISIADPSSVTSAIDISTLYSQSGVNFDAYTANNNLYIAFNGTDLGGAIRVTYLDSTLAQHNTAVITGHSATMVSVTADVTGPTASIYVSYSDGTDSYIFCLSQILNSIFGDTSLGLSGTINNITSTASNGKCQVFYEVANTYTYDSSIATNFINAVTVLQAGTVGSITTVDRSLGLASKAFTYNSNQYVLGVYDSPYQPTYFLVNYSGNVVSKLAYSNAGGYYSTAGLPNVTLNNNTAQICYLYKDQITAVNKTQGSSSAGIYAQLGINLAEFTIGTSNITTSEIGGSLHLSGGFLWQFDGFIPVEHNFFLWPDSIECTWSTSGGSIVAQPNGTTNTDAYFYQVTYEWTDNAGMIHRSAPSIPVAVTTSGSGTSGSITVNVPTLRLTYKIASPVKIVIYRWSVANEVYYQVTSVSSPTLNNPTVDYIAYVDTLADASIVGNSIIYTAGGVIEDIAAPASNIVTLYNDRLWLLDAEDPNLWWFSKQVIEGTPVEMSDLLTYYIAPSIGSQGSTGPVTAGAAMDDKLISFKPNAIYYTNGNGPNNTGSNNQYSDPIFITSVVGCANQKSIVFTPSGLMFQSDKGIWLLGRDLGTSYIGAPVEDFTLGAQVLSALNIPETTQVRFTLSSGKTLMYDYYFNRWSVFKGIPGISSTLYNSLHTYLNSYGSVLQETPSQYLDNSNPVLISLTTSWIAMAGLQGFERFYEMLLLGKYYTPFKLNVGLSYDYNPGPYETKLIAPTNYSPSYGSLQLWGSGGPWGGPSNTFKERLFPTKQKVESFQITLNEIYDPSFGVAAGAGLTLSGIALVIGMKKGYRTQSAKNTT